MVIRTPASALALLLLAVGLGFVAQRWLIPDHPLSAWLVWSTALGATAGFLRLQREQQEAPVAAPPAPVFPGRLRILTVLLLATVTVFAGHLGWLGYHAHRSIQPQGWQRVLADWGLLSADNRCRGLQCHLFMVGMVILAGLVLRLRALPMQPQRRSARWEWLVLGGIVVLALLARTWSLTAIPPEIYDNEYYYGWHEAGIMGSRSLFHEDIFRGGHEGVPVMTFVNMAPFVRLLGNSLWTWRFSAACFGTASVVFAFLLVRRWYGAICALVCAVLLAGWSVHVHHSRIGASLYVQAMMFTTAVLWLWSCAVQGRWDCWVWAGLLMGHGLQNYAAVRILPVLVILLTGLCLAAQWRLWKYLLLGLLLMAGATVVTVGPFMQELVGRQEQLTHRLSITVWGDSEPAKFLRQQFTPAEVPPEVGLQHTNWMALLWHQLLLNFGMFHVFPENPTEFPQVYGRLGPHLEPLTAALVLIGLVVMIGQDHHRLRTWLFLTWLVVTIIAGGVLTTQSPKVQRLLPACVPLLLPAAVVVSRGTQLLAVVSRTAACAWVVMIPLLCGLTNMHEYLGAYFQHFYEPAPEKLLWQAILAQDPQDRLIVTPVDIRYQQAFFPHYAITRPEDVKNPSTIRQPLVSLLYSEPEMPGWCLPWLEIMTDTQWQRLPVGAHEPWTVISGQIKKGGQP